MRDIVWLSVLVLLSVCLLSVVLPPSTVGVAGQYGGETDASHNVVVVTIRPVQLLVTALLGDERRVRCLLPPGMSPHTYAPRPSDVALLRRAALFVSVSSTLDGWSAQIPARQRYRCLDAVPAAWLRDMQAHGHAHDETCTHVDVDGHNHNDNHGNNHAGKDPHFWMDPLTCAAALPALADVLSGVFPDEATQIHQRMLRVQADIRLRHQQLALRAEALRGQAVVQFHPSFNYLFARYQIINAGVIDPVAGAGPSTRHVQSLIDQHQKTGALYAVIAEPQLPQRPARIIADHLSAPLCILDPMAAQADTLLDMWQQTLDALLAVQVLSPSPAPAEPKDDQEMKQQ